MDAFFAAVEQRENPELKGKAVIVGADPGGGTGRGVVAACSYEARRFGIHSAMPIRQAWRLCPQGTYLRPDHKLYSSVSRKIMDILETFTDRLEPISIDEAFLDFSDSARLWGSPLEIARKVKSCILRQEDLTASIGIAGNKFLAKVASDRCKPDGILWVREGTEKEFLAPLPVSRIWGVGEKTEKYLHSCGWKTVGQLAALPIHVLEARLGKFGHDLWLLANGVDHRPVCRDSETKSIGHELTFDVDTDDVRVWSVTLLQLCEKVSARLRHGGLSGRTVTLKVRLENFQTFTHRKSLRSGISTTEEIYPLVRRLLEETVPGPVRLRLLGVYLSGFDEGKSVQRSLLDQEPRKWQALSRAVDEVRDRYGNRSIRRAALLDPPGSNPTEPEQD